AILTCCTYHRFNAAYRNAPNMQAGVRTVQARKTRSSSHGAPVELLDGQRGRIHPFETAHVDAHRLVPLRVVAPAERTHAAAPAKHVVDPLGTELVVGHRVFGGLELESRGRDEREQPPGARTNRTGARHEPIELQLDHVADISTMTAAGVLLHGAKDYPPHRIAGLNKRVNG